MAAARGVRAAARLHRSRRDFAPRVAELAALGRVVLPDLRGHGESTNTGTKAGYTFEQVAADLLASSTRSASSAAICSVTRWVG